MMFSHTAKHFLPITSSSSVSSCSSVSHHHHSSKNYTMNGQRKRQRRQTAGALVSNLLGGGAAAGPKKSTAQPRPAIQIPPRGIGPVQEPNINDVLCGRGGRINSHAGNVQFRIVVAERKPDYLAKTTKKLEKAHIAAQVVQSIRNMEPGGRFLKEDADGDWYDIGDSKAIKKVGQALREDAPDIRTGGSGSGGDDEDDDKNNDSENQDSKSNKSDPKKPAAKPTSPAANVPSSHSSDVVTHPKQLGMTVSGRGAKAVTVPVARQHQHHQQEHQHQQHEHHQHQQHEHQHQQHQHQRQHGQQHSQQPKQPAYQPLAYQHVLPPPMYAQVVPSQTPSHNDNASATGRGTGTFYQNVRQQQVRAPAFSGAAAAALNEPDNAQEEHGMFQVPPTRDVAFDRTFYPPPLAGGEHWTEDRSQISALSGPSTMLSGLSDPMSSLTAGEPGQRRSGGAIGPSQQQQQQQQQSRITQLAAMRQQWTAHQQQQREMSSGSIPVSDISALKNSGSTGIASSAGLSLQRSLSFPDVLQNIQTGSIREDMSWTDMNSLVGGGIGGSVLSGASFNMAGGTPGNSLLSGASSNIYPIPLREAMTGEQRATSGSSRASARNNSSGSSSRSTSRMGTNLAAAAPPRERVMSNMSVSIASMSINSGADSLPSIPGSIMSDLSEGLIALDLAVPRMLDKM